MNALGAVEDLNETACHRMDDTEADFEALFHRYFPAVYGILVRLVRDRVEAEELAIEVFWRLSKRPAVWFFSRPVAPWLYRTATNAGLDALRMSQRRRKYEASAPSTSSGGELPLEKVLREESRQAVQEVLGRMKVTQAQILLLRADGSSYKELAEALNVRASSVGTLLARAEAEFQKLYVEFVARKENS